MNDTQSVLRTVSRVIEAELNPEVVVILMRVNGESYMQPCGNSQQWPELVLSAAARVAVMLADELNTETTNQKEEQK
jgi:hypothetical protein